MEKIRDEIYAEIDRMYETAMTIHRGWMKKVARRELDRVGDVKLNTEKTNYELRLEFSGSSFVIRWNKISFVRNNDKPIRLVKSIAVPNNGIYKEINFKEAESWDLALIMQAESALGPIRQQLKHLMKAHRSIVWASKVIGSDEIEVKLMNSRVTVPDYSIKKFKNQMI